MAGVRIVTLVAVLAFGFAPRPAFAQAQGALDVSVTTAPPGGAVRISGAGCVAGADVEIRFDGELVQNAEAGADGSFSSVITIASGTARGAHALSALCGSSAGASITLTAQITVTTAPLAGTGAPDLLLLLSMSMVAAGIGLVLIGRRLATSGRLPPS